MDVVEFKFVYVVGDEIDFVGVGDVGYVNVFDGLFG